MAATDQGDDRFDRNERLFGKEGQAAIRATHVTLVGAGGLGTHVAQQLALLGVGELTPVDHEELTKSNRNRYVGAWAADPIPGSHKVDLIVRLVGLSDPTIKVTPIYSSFPSPEALEAVKSADYVFGCVDGDGPRFVLNEACIAYDRPLFDLASDVPEPGCYGGRVSVVMRKGGCLHCRGVLDPKDVRRYLSPSEALENEDAEYGIHRTALSEAGPSVVSINGVVASLAVTEFMVAVTGLREPVTHLEYRGHLGTVSKRVDEPYANCYLCQGFRGIGPSAQLERYFGLAKLRTRA
jgi:molybdopterin/thiamine biosynthesis adenylyltransferase